MAMDFDLFIRLSKKYPPKMIDREWAYFTIHDNQKSSSKNLLTEISDITDILQRENLSWIKIQKTVSKYYFYLFKSFIKNIFIRFNFINKRYVNIPISLEKKSNRIKSSKS